MDQIEQATPSKQGSQWVIAATCGALVLIVTVGGMIAMRDQFLAEARSEATKQTAAREKLSARVDSLQSTVEAIGSQPKADSEALAVLETKITDLTTKLDVLSEQVATLAKAPDPAPPAATIAAPTSPVVPAPTATPTAATPALDATGRTTLTTLKLAVLSGKPFASELAAWAKNHPEAAKQTFTLASVAESGLISESELKRKLSTVLDEATASKKIDDASVAGKLNTHLSGLISIKKSDHADAYEALRKNLLRDDISTLTRSVEALDEALRTPFDTWLNEARTRRDALEALGQLDTGSGL